MLRLEGVGALSLPIHPCTAAPAPPHGAAAGVGAAGLRFEMLEPCRRCVLANRRHIGG